MNDDQTLLASAYLDGDVTPDERARVESSPELLAEVERLRQVRAVLGGGEPPAISMRERHLAAALGAWDRLPDVERIAAVRDQTPRGVDAVAAAAAASVSAPASLGARRAARNRTWLYAAAAGLVVVLAGGIVLNNLRTGSTDDTASVLSADQDEGSETLTQSTDAAGDLGARVIPATDAPAAEQAPADAFDEADIAAADAEAPPPEDAEILLENPNDLADFAVFVRDATLDTSGGDGTQFDAPAEGGFDVPRCDGIDIVVGPARYRDELVVVGIDEDRNLAIAHRIEDCVEVARARLP